MASTTLQCKACGKAQFLMPPRRGVSAVIEIAQLNGWIYTSKKGWVCSAECRDAIDKVKGDN